MKKVLVGLFVLALCGANSMGVPVAQWSFDNMTTGTVNVGGTDYTVNQAVDASGNGNNLELGVGYTGANVPAPPFSASTIPTVVTGKVGNGLSFDGVYNEAYAPGAWKGYKDMTVDFWFNGGDTQSGGNTLVTASAIWEISIANRYLNFTTWNGSTGAGNTWTYIWWLPAANTWYHVIAGINADGLKTVQVLNAAGTSLYSGSNQVTNGVGYQGIKQANAPIDMGSANNWSAHYNGVIDEVTITPEPTTLAVLGLGALLLRKRK